MKTERIVLSFIAIVIGILVAGVGFYLYQSTKVVPSQKPTITLVSPTSTPESSLFLTIDSPKDEDVVDTKTITLNGKTNSDSTIVISTSISDQIISPASNGNFSATITIESGQNQIEVTAIAPDGQERKVVRTITVSTESF